MLGKLKQFKDLRDQAKQMQSMMADVKATGDSEGGKVVVTLDGNMSITGLAIDDSLVASGNADKLQDAIKKAHADAMKKLQRELAMKMRDMGGLNFPGLS